MKDEGSGGMGGEKRGQEIDREGGEGEKGRRGLGTGVVLASAPTSASDAHGQVFEICRMITLRASCGAVYCNRSCLCVCGCVCSFCLWVCYHDNSILRASILTKLGL